MRQETTMAEHGTQPEFIYQRHCISSELTTYYCLFRGLLAKMSQMNRKLEDLERTLKLRNKPRMNAEISLNTTKAAMRMM